MPDLVTQRNIGSLVVPVTGVFPQNAAAGTINGASIDRTLHNMAGYSQSKLASVSAEQIEALVIAQVKEMIAAPEIAYRAYKLATAEDASVTINDVQAALKEFNGLWDQLFPIERNRIIQLLIERIEICDSGAKFICHPNGLVTLCREIQSHRIAALAR